MRNVFAWVVGEEGEFGRVGEDVDIRKACRSSTMGLSLFPTSSFSSLSFDSRVAFSNERRSLIGRKASKGKTSHLI